jgi:hypothetical protein
MELSTILSMAGLLLNTFGIGLIYFYGLSPYVSTGGYTMLYSEKSINNTGSEMNKKKRKYFRLAVAGVLMCVSGNVFQMFALFF